MRTGVLLSLALATPGMAAASDSGGPLSVDEAAYDVLRQPELPRLRSSRQGDELTLWWETVGRLPFPMPVEIVGAGGEVVRLDMETGRVTLPWPAGQAAPVVDPRERILRAAD